MTLKKLIILDVTLPADFDDAIKQTQVVKQEQDQYNYTKEIAEIDGQTSLLVAYINQEIATVTAEANAEAI